MVVWGDVVRIGRHDVVRDEGGGTFPKRRKKPRKFGEKKLHKSLCDGPHVLVRLRNSYFREVYRESSIRRPIEHQHVHVPSTSTCTRPPPVHVLVLGTEATTHGGNLRDHLAPALLQQRVDVTWIGGGPGDVVAISPTTREEMEPGAHRGDHGGGGGPGRLLNWDMAELRRRGGRGRDRESGTERDRHFLLAWERMEQLVEVGRHQHLLIRFLRILCDVLVFLYAETGVAFFKKFVCFHVLLQEPLCRSRAARSPSPPQDCSASSSQVLLHWNGDGQIFPGTPPLERRRRRPAYLPPRPRRVVVGMGTVGGPSGWDSVDGELGARRC